MAKTEELQNDYRSERKKRIAKAAKANKKGKKDSTKAIAIAIYVVAIICVIALFISGLYYFGVPQKYMTAVTVNGENVSYAEYSYYYASVYQSYVSQAEEQKESYGFALFDTTKDPAAQKTKDDDGNEITYADLINNGVMDTIQQTAYYYNLAKEAGMTLNADHSAEVDSAVKSVETYASTYGYSASRYVSILYGKGMNIKLFRELLEKQYLVSQYLEDIEDEISKDITKDEITKKYEEDPQAFQQVDIRLFGFEIPKEKDAEKASEKDVSETELLAKEYESKITDEESFKELAKEYCQEEDKETFEQDSATLLTGLKKSVVKSNISEDLADWLFSSDRKEGETTVCTTDTYAYVLYVKVPAYLAEDLLVDARHILVSFDAIKEELEKKDKKDESETAASDTADEETTAAKEKEEEEIKVSTQNASDGTAISNKDTGYTIDVVLNAYEKAHDILDEFGDGEGSEDAFAALAEKYSNDTGSVGENGKGGLYTNIEKGTMVTEFENWVYDAKRQSGDTAIIRTQYGYHVMYFVKQHEDPAYVETIRATIAAEKAEEVQKTDEANYKDTATEAKFYDFSCKKALELVNQVYVSSNS